LGAESAGALETPFRQPPAGAHCKTWWHWMNGNITAEGITLDIEATKRVGIRSFQISQVGTGIPPVRSAWPRWHATSLRVIPGRWQLDCSDREEHEGSS
jgi:hypothetical protein